MLLGPLQAWAFMPLAQLPELVVEFKRDVYQQVGFSGHLGAA